MDSAHQSYIESKSQAQLLELRIITKEDWKMSNLGDRGMGGIKSDIRVMFFSCLIILACGHFSAFGEQGSSNIAADATSLGWPVWPDSTYHRIGGAHGWYVCIMEGNCTPVLHPGIDILIPDGTPVYAIKSGYVKYLDMLTPHETQWCIVIGDSSGTEECAAWAYVHLDSSSIPHSVGDTIVAGQFLGNIVVWPQPEWDHLHFGEISSQGDSVAWNDKNQWRYLSNALNRLDPAFDPDPPVIEFAYGSQVFAFVTNNSDSYFSTGSPINGNVDIVCKAYDVINDDNFETIPYRIDFQISGDTIIPWTNAFCFVGEVFTAETRWYTDVIYKDDATCNTQGDYNGREFYFNLTNTDGDSVVELGDKDYSWQTSYFHNGQYTVSARAYDAYGNMAMESMDVSVENYFELSGTILLSNKQGLDQTIVTVVSSGQTDTTDEAGYFSIPDVGGGSQLVEIRQGGYEPVDIVLMMSQSQQLDLILDLIYVCGNANGDGDVNVGDAVFLINYVFKGGPAPDPLEAGDANCDGQVNVGDAVYLISYVFKGGPEPCCP
jgi:hypothetical protein